MNLRIKRSVAYAGIVGTGFILFKMGAPVMAQDDEQPKAALVCTLTTPELQERRAGIIAHLRESALEFRELKTGWSIRYAEEQAVELVEFIRLERKCCSFFEFTLHFEAGTGPIWLSITGPAGAKNMIAAELGPISGRAREQSK